MGQPEESVPVGPVGKFLNPSAAETGGNIKLRPLYLGGRNFFFLYDFRVVFLIMEDSLGIPYFNVLKCSLSTDKHTF